MSVVARLALTLVLVLGTHFAPSADSVRYGVTFYGMKWAGRGLGCGGAYSEELSPWAAVPIEWVRDGYVRCGDIVEVTWNDGRTLSGPVRDTGCHLHYGVWDTGVPFGAEFDVYNRDGLPTATATVEIFRDGFPLPVSTFPTIADSEYCDGPYSIWNWPLEPR